MIMSDGLHGVRRAAEFNSMTFASLPANDHDFMDSYHIDPIGKPTRYARAFIPPTERNEVAGFDFVGDNDAIRAEVIQRLNASAAYRKLFAKRFPL